MAFAWTDERIAMITRLRAEGLTASQIAEALGEGVSRDAVIGKLWRLGIPAPSAQVVARSRALASCQPKPAKAAAAARKPAEAAMSVSTPPKATPEPPAPQAPAPLGAGPAHAALQPRECRWPIGDPAAETFRFCKARCVRPDDMPRARNGQLRVPIYCTAHYELSVQPSAERRTTRIMAAA